MSGHERVHASAMRPMLHARLVNGRFGDPALFVEMLHRRGALLFDAGDLSALSSRDLLRIGHVFISHMHIDHFIGFDSLVRVHVGRSKTIRVFTPPGGCERVGHKLKAYEWDLVDRYDSDLVFEVLEVGAEGLHRALKFRLKGRFDCEQMEFPQAWNDVFGLRLDTALLGHRGPCLGFAISEPLHVNVWKSRLDERGLPTGNWLQQLKAAVIAGDPDSTIIRISATDQCRLSELRDLVTVSRGQKIAYVTDVADTRANRAAIVHLAADADLFFLEARFAAEDAHQALERAHLTTDATGEIARAAAVRRLEPFHFSARYEGEEGRMLDEVAMAFLGKK